MPSAAGCAYRLRIHHVPVHTDCAHILSLSMQTVHADCANVLSLRIQTAHTYFRAQTDRFKALDIHQAISND